MTSALKQLIPTGLKRWVRHDNPVCRLIRDRRLITSRPVFLNIEVTTRCNLACRMCPHESLGASNGQDMPFDLLRQIVNEAGALPGIAFYLFGLGEPLLYEQLPEVVAHIRSCFPQNDIVLDTNGHYLRGPEAESVLDCDRVLISLNAGSADSYLWLTGSNAYDAVTANVRELLRRRQRSRRYQDTGKPFVNIQFLDTDRTRHELPAFRQQWEPLLDGGGAVNVKSVTNWGGAVDTGLLRGPRPATRRYPCIYLWHSLAVDVHGNVYPCCEALGRRRDSALRLGRIGERSLAEIYFSRPLHEARHLNLADQYAAIADCRKCDIYSCHRNVWLRLPLALQGRRWV